MYEALKEGNDGDVGGSLKGLVNVRDVRSVIRTPPAGEASGDGHYIPYHSSNPKQRPPKRRPIGSGSTVVQVRISIAGVP